MRKGQRNSHDHDTLGTQRDHYCPASLSYLHLLTPLPHAHLYRLLRLFPRRPWHDAFATVLSALLRSDKRGRDDSQDRQVPASLRGGPAAARTGCHRCRRAGRLYATGRRQTSSVGIVSGSPRLWIGLSLSGREDELLQQAAPRLPTTLRLRWWHARDDAPLAGAIGALGTPPPTS